jgi:hypothetical protein
LTAGARSFLVGRARLRPIEADLLGGAPELRAASLLATLPEPLPTRPLPLLGAAAALALFEARAP